MPQSPVWSNILSPGKGKPPHQTLSNAVRVLDHDPLWAANRLWLDEFANRVMVCELNGSRVWRDDDDTALTVYIQETTGMTRIPKAFVRDAVDLVARRRGRHAVREYLSTLKWDGVERIAHAFEDHWGVDCNDGQPSDYIRAASRNFFIGLVARVEHPGCKLDTMVVFEGPQGQFKSSALDRLGGEWYAAIDESAATKDFLQVLQGKWLVELCEMNAVSKAESASVKSMLSRRIDTYRTSYGHRAIDVPRQCVFAGTTNRTDYSIDDTGERRFWPMRCGFIDLDGLSRTRDQLFAEAVAQYRAHASWWEMPASATEVQADRLPDHAWTPLILNGVLGVAEITLAEVLIRLVGFKPENITKPAEMTAGSILRRAGWTCRPVRKPGQPPRRLWYPPVSV